MTPTTPSLPPVEARPEDRAFSHTEFVRLLGGVQMPGWRENRGFLWRLWMNKHLVWWMWPYEFARQVRLWWRDVPSR